MQYFLAERSGVDVGIYLGRTNILMAQHGLDGTEVGTAMQQCRGETVAQRMRRDCFLDTGLHGLPFNHYQNHGTRQMSHRADSGIHSLPRPALPS